MKVKYDPILNDFSLEGFANKVCSNHCERTIAECNKCKIIINTPLKDIVILLDDNIGKDVEIKKLYRRLDNIRAIVNEGYCK
jgi:hypothetical protein